MDFTPKKNKPHWGKKKRRHPIKRTRSTQWNSNAACLLNRWYAPRNIGVLESMISPELPSNAVPLPRIPEGRSGQA